MTASALDDALRRLRATALGKLAERLGFTVPRSECEELAQALRLDAALDEIGRRRRWWLLRWVDAIGILRTRD